MTVTVLVGVAVLGGAGAAARFLLDTAVSSRARRMFPYGTLLVNLSGAFALGLLVGVALHGDALRLAGTGLIGGYTTFSTWMLEAHRLAEDGRFMPAAANILVSAVLGLIVAWLGRHAGGAL